MKKTILFLFLTFSIGVFAQKVALKKGSIIQGIPISDSISESYALYLPTNFDITKKWPIVFLYDMQGRGKQIISMFRQAAENQGYVLAASNNVQDSLSLSKNILVSSRMFNQVYGLLPISKDRSYTAGFDGGARMASLIPTFVKEIQGVISCGSPIANEEVLSTKHRFEFIGIVGTEDYNYPTMLNSKKLLGKLKFQNELIVFEGGHKWPNSNLLEKALEVFTLTAMARKLEIQDKEFVNLSYERSIKKVDELIAEKKPLMASKLLNEVVSVYHDHKNVDSLKVRAKILRKSKIFKSKNRSQNTAFFKESFIKEDFVYYLGEDVRTYNYNNLGWWKYRMDELDKYEKGINVFEKQMGRRLKGYMNALIADYIEAYMSSESVDEEAITFLWMVNTITDAKNPNPYLKVISNSARVEDYETALFYVEELLKTGYANKEQLYALDHTALLRLTPEFNELVSKFLKDARYDLIIEKN